MLIKRELLDRIAQGEIDLAFRRWRRPTVRAGGTLRTAVGVLAIEAVDVVAERSITTAHAERAGFESRATLLAELRSRDTGDAATEIYRIRLSPQGEDPRIALRRNGRLSGDDLRQIETRLARFDAASRKGPWTREVLRLIAARPATRAEDLASSIGWDKPRFKANVRKLKELGLTESLEVGYRLSPRGRSFVRGSGI